MIKLGTSDLSKAYVGSSEVSKMYLGNKLVYSKEPEVLPYDAEIEYLESTGTQYIDLGIYFDSTKVYRLKVGFFANGTTGFRVFGARSQSGALPKSTYLTFKSNNQPIFIASDTMESLVTSLISSISLKTMTTFELCCFPTKYYKVNDVDNGSSYIEQSDFQSEFTLALFTENTSGTYAPKSCRFGRLEIFEPTTGVYEHDYVPVRVGSVGYIYDKVTRRLLGNNGSGNFILGHDINETYDSEVEYIESTGLEYIDTCYMPDGTDIRITGKYHINSYQSSYARWFGAYTNENTDSYRIIRKNTDDSGVIFTCGNKAGGSSSAEISGLNNTYEFEMDNNGITINNIHTENLNKTTGTSNNVNIILFGSETGSKVSAKLYYFQIYKNDILVRDFIPVRKNGEGCLYDRVSGGIFHNGGSGAFIYGNDV